MREDDDPLENQSQSRTWVSGEHGSRGGPKDGNIVRTLCRSICTFKVSVFPFCELGYRYTQYGAFNTGLFVDLDEPRGQQTSAFPSHA